MAYRKTKQAARQWSDSRRAAEQAKRAETPGDYPDPLPELRRLVIIIDQDSGTPMIRTMALYRSDRIDCYKACVKGKVWKSRIGWSNILAGIRRSFPRVAHLSD